MIDDKTPDTSGQPNYEQNIPASQEAASTSTESKIQDISVKSDESENVGKYEIGGPIREIIYAKIVKQELQRPRCTEPEQTKTSE